MKKKFKPLPALLRLRLYIAANYENKLEADVRYNHMVWGSVIIKRFNRAWYNPMKYILGDVGKKVVDPRTLNLDTNDINFETK